MCFKKKGMMVKMAGGPYNIPRSYKGESKILMIFSTKAFIFTVVGAGIGILLYFLFRLIGLSQVGIVFIILLALIGFVIGTFKIPENNNWEITRKTGGENIDQVILRWIKFKQKKKRVYIYKEEEQKVEK